jgi:mannose/cellobiose epimerase-like protein (N-acyl-D-glucosamine 2-epimerase family)
VDKVTRLREEILIGTLMPVEHTGSQWAKDWFGKAWYYSNGKLMLKQYGFPFRVVSGDRKVTFVRKASRCEHFHHPRHLMQNIQAIYRIFKRGGTVSGFRG